MKTRHNDDVYYKLVNAKMRQKKYKLKAIDEHGMPNMDYEYFFQQGINCYSWGFPKHLIKQAFKKAADDWKKDGMVVEMWHIRAFVEGVHGEYSRRTEIFVDQSYEWPKPVDPSWKLVVCAYPDGYCEIDMVHSVSRKFWSEDNDFIEPPDTGHHKLMSSWYKGMGFDMIYMSPAMTVTTSPFEKQLTLVK